MKTIEIKCKGSEELDLEQIEAFQGNLKDLSKENYDRLRKQILELGFSAPIAVWKHEGHNYCLDGHQRIRVLTEMKRAEGFTIPKLPVFAVEASTEHEAKKKILALASQFGEITGQGLFEFASVNNIDLLELDGFRLPEIDMETFKKEFFDIDVVEFPELNTETDSPDLKQMTFIVHNDQALVLERALKKAKAMGEFVDTGNENSNGNALARICEVFLAQNADT